MVHVIGLSLEDQKKLFEESEGYVMLKQHQVRNEEGNYVLEVDYRRFQEKIEHEAFASRHNWHFRRMHKSVNKGSPNRVTMLFSCKASTCLSKTAIIVAPWGCQLLKRERVGLGVESCHRGFPLNNFR